MRKGDLSINLIIIVAIGLLILVLISIFLFRGFNPLTKECQNVQGTCADSCEDLSDGETNYQQHISAKCTQPEQVCCIRIG